MSQPPIEESLEAFKIDVNQFTEIDKKIKDVEDQMKPLKDSLKKLKDEKKLIQNDICFYMGENEIKKVNLPNMKAALSYTETKRAIPLTKDKIREEIKRFFMTGPGSRTDFMGNSPLVRAELMFNFLYDEMEYKITPSIRKVKPST